MLQLQSPQLGFPNFRHAVRRYYLRTRASTSPRLNGYALGADSASTALLPPLTASQLFWSLIPIAGASVGAYHGYKRNQSLGWAIVWALAGGLVPIITVPVAFAQGIGKRKAS